MSEQRSELPKAPTGISGLDGVTGGGLPRGRPTLVCGPAGCGKTLLGVEFLVRGITKFGEPGVFVAFEESTDDLVANVASLGFDLARLVCVSLEERMAESGESNQPMVLSDDEHLILERLAGGHNAAEAMRAQVVLTGAK